MLCAVTPYNHRLLVAVVVAHGMRNNTHFLAAEHVPSVHTVFLELPYIVHVSFVEVLEHFSGGVAAHASAMRTIDASMSTNAAAFANRGRSTANFEIPLNVSCNPFDVTLRGKRVVYGFLGSTLTEWN